MSILHRDRDNGGETGDYCECCETVRGLISELGLGSLRLKLDVLHSEHVTITGLLERIMTAQEDIARAVAAQAAAITEQGAALAAIQAGAPAPVDTSGLVTSTAELEASTAALAAAAPPAAPPAAAPAAVLGARTEQGPLAEPVRPASPF